MEFRQLRYFLAIVEAGSVSAASRRIHIAQPALTRQMRLLEEELEIKLFERHARGISLTMAGRSLVEYAEELVARHDELKGRLAALGHGMTGRLNLAVTVTHLWMPQVSALLREYRQRYPSVAMEVTPLLSGPQLERLREGTLDAGLLYLDRDDTVEITSMKVRDDKLLLAVPADSHWASNPPQRLSELEHTDFVWAFRHISPEYHDRMTQHFRRLNFHPRVVQYGADNIAILSMVSAGLGITIVPDSACANPMPSVVFLRMEELEQCIMPLHLAWREDNDSPTVANLGGLVREHLET
ncbi:LysR family transcriptional regulator [Halomonas huangheensis]|uniref:HTH lysR-type domain-containing protein n=1 Tax=Halomonas huangheensis TaxID=1178482 RepID=W1ND76_9GAMM|nr:LysR family transcriptional regulator [Halomonas huangheensis]ALM52803.1 LysR family transcriptional regulator [Halomonas huangheensis]ERL53286.1 hypothetical protein BJB45_18615 [Halomonas huangheensis]